MVHRSTGGKYGAEYGRGDCVGWGGRFLAVGRSVVVGAGGELITLAMSVFKFVKFFKYSYSNSCG